MCWTDNATSANATWLPAAALTVERQTNFYQATSDSETTLAQSGLMLGYEPHALPAFQPGGHVDSSAHDGFTFSCWIKVAHVSTGGYLVTKDSASGTTRGTGDGNHRRWAFYIQEARGSSEVPGLATVANRTRTLLRRSTP